ncbi:hypothetical protein [Streptomyces akebiae]|uniref:hypothetical protein n=1 Tax=Streptomyces akebiae TaxID=2865673 RepID=UPI002175B286|nr:hypothetical protein [Streptomyces akebiae]
MPSGRTVRPLGTREAGGHLVKVYALEAPGRRVTDTAAAFGTLTYEILAGATAAVDFLAALDPGSGTSRRERLAHSLDSLHQHELTLRARLQESWSPWATPSPCTRRRPTAPRPS